MKYASLHNIVRTLNTQLARVLSVPSRSLAGCCTQSTWTKRVWRTAIAAQQNSEIARASIRTMCQLNSNSTAALKLSSCTSILRFMFSNLCILLSSIVARNNDRGCVGYLGGLPALPATCLRNAQYDRHG